MTNSQVEPLENNLTSLLQEFEFEVVFVDRQGDIIEHETCSARQFTEDLGNGVRLEMVSVPGGTFRMGSREGQGFEDEYPQHSGNIAPFFMSKYPITQEQWAAVMEWMPLYRCVGAKRPVDRVSWEDARDFCVQLSKKSGRLYHLPSEAQWEYACRAGTRTPFYFGETITTDLVNYVGEHTFLSEPKGVYRHETTDVGEFPPNAFGLYDMHGNVWEWCADAWHDDYHGAPSDGSAWASGEPGYYVQRGGSWHEPPNNCRSAIRLKFRSIDRDDCVGFRVALGSLERQEVPGHGNAEVARMFLQRISQRLRAWFGR